MNVSQIKIMKQTSTKVFLGGTCNGSTWRDKLIPLLKVEFFNPVVPDWTPEAAAQELKERDTCDFCLYVITPKMTGVYSIAEVADDSNKRPKKTIFCVLDEDEDQSFSKAQAKSLKAVGDLVVRNGGTYCGSLEEVAVYLNERRYK